jgi:uncharacterized protein YdhG (YjbR/CyaY superfamily)
MAVKKPATKATKKPVKPSKVFSKFERDAMVERAREVKAQRAGEDLEQMVLAKIAEMQPTDRAMAQRIHTIIRTNAPDLSPKLWYGMPAYYRDGKALCFFQDAAKFKARYATFGFNDSAKLDDGGMWPIGFAVQKLTPAVEAKITELVRKAAG